MVEALTYRSSRVAGAVGLPDPGPVEPPEPGLVEPPEPGLVEPPESPQYRHHSTQGITAA